MKDPAVDQRVALVACISEPAEETYPVHLNSSP